MLTNKIYEDLPFSDGQIIITSRIVQNEYSDEMHWHPFAEILLCLKSGNSVTLNFRRYDMKPNDFIICFPGDLHSIQNNSPDAFLIIQFPLQLLTVVREFNKLTPILSHNAFFKYSPGDYTNEKLVFSLNEIVITSEQTIPFVEAKLYSKLLSFFSLFGEYCLQKQVDDITDYESGKYKATRLMADACIYISQNCSEQLTLESTAEHIGISKSYFSHLFKDYTQMTFVEYLTKERIRKAEKLFFGPKKKFIDIAFECGFTSISSFNRTFKRIKGISPSEFRKALIQASATKNTP